MNSRGQISWLTWALIFLVLAIVASLFGFGLVAGVSYNIAKWLAVIFIVLLIVSIIAHAMRRV